MKRNILIVDDETNMQAVMRLVLEEAGHAVRVADSGEAALPHLRDPNLDVVVTDLRMPGMGGDQLIELLRRDRPDVPVIVVTAHGTIPSAVKAINQGAADYLTKPFEPDELVIAVHNALKLHDILRENEKLKAAVSQSLGTRQLIGTGVAAQRLQEEIRRVAPYKTNVLISGESGTGKELVARTIHELSPRHPHPWVAINCSAIPRDLMESELFGYVKGAFTGASQNRLGRLDQANGGTLFLDEIGDLDLSLQAKLLRVLQEREYSPVGSNQVRGVDVRFLAATNRDLKQMVRDGKFREDLLYRLDVYHLAVPPLRERREDIPLLAERFLHDFRAETGKPVRGFSPEVTEVLGRYAWPGNVRELRNAVERSLLSCRGELIEIADLPQAVLAGAGQPVKAAAAGARPADQDLDGWLTEVERRAILDALSECNGVQAQAARRLGVSERSLWHRIKKLNIQVTRSAG
jgi:DNA-binding NtrC family response regulator